MIDRQVSRPSGYTVRGSLLVSYRLPLLPYCFVLCQESADTLSIDQQAQLLVFFQAEARRLAKRCASDPEAYVFIQSGKSARRRSGLHVHVFVIQTRWQKAWLYAVLGAKNIALTVHGAVWRRSQPRQSSRSKR